MADSTSRQGPGVTPHTTVSVPRDDTFAAATLGSPPASSRVWVVLAVVAGIACLLTQALLVWGSSHATFPFDEVTLLQMSRYLMGEEVPQLRGAGYYPLWAVVMAPLWWLTDDPVVFYRLSLALGAIVAMITAWPLSALAMRLGTSRAQAWFAAFTVLALPAHAVQSAFSLSEQLIVLALALLALAVWRLYERPSALAAITVALLAAATYAAHLRMIVVVLATAVWLLLFIRRRWQVALIGLAALAAFYFVADATGIALNVAVRGSASSQSDAFLDNLETTGPFLVVKIALAQAWTQIVGSFGVAALGAVAVVAGTWRSIRALQPTPVIWLFGVLSSTTVISVISWIGEYNLFFNPWRRLDAWIYGRYLDPVATLVVLIGLALILCHVRRRLAAWAAWLKWP